MSAREPVPPAAAPAPLRPDVTIVVPVATQAAEVDEVVAALGGELDRLGRRWECILVFDGIRGVAWERGIALQERTANQVRTIALHKPFGESVCLSSAFEHAFGQVILTSPQYVQIDPHAVAEMLAQVDAGVDLVATRRVQRVDSWTNRVQSAVFNWIMRRLVGASFHDLNCTLRAIRREVLEQLTVYGDMYRYLPAIAYRQGFRVSELDARHLKELGPSGFFGPAAYVRRMLDILAVMFLTKFTHKPLRFFGFLGAVTIAFGAAVMLGLLVHWLLDPSAGFLRRPLFFVSVLLIMLGAQVIGFGLVGEVIIFTQARNVREYRIERIYE